MAKVISSGTPATQDPDIEIEADDAIIEDEGDAPEEQDAPEPEQDDESTDSAEDPEEVAEDEEGSDEGDAEVARQVSKKKSASEVIRAQKAELKQLREDREKDARDKIERQAREDERNRIASQQNQALTEQRERELLETLDPVERVRYEAKKSEQRILAELNRTRIEAADAKDHAAFQAKIAADPDLEAYSDEVEQTLQKVRAGGGNTDRTTTLAYLIGRDALANKGQKKSSVRAAADRRVRQVSSKAPTGRASEGATRGKGKTSEDRLAGVII